MISSTQHSGKDKTRGTKIRSVFTRAGVGQWMHHKRVQGTFSRALQLFHNLMVVMVTQLYMFVKTQGALKMLNFM
jgi:hypothetical protein